MTKEICCPNCKQNFQLGEKGIPDANKASTILGAVREHFQLSKKQLFGRNRKHAYVAARHIAFYLIYYKCNYSQTEVGALFGRDHTTVINGLHRIKQSVKTQTDLYGDLMAVKAMLNPLKAAA